MNFRLKSYSILISLFISGCLKDDGVNQPFVTYEPITHGDGLTISTPTNESMDAIALNEIYNEVYVDKKLWPLRSLLVFRNEKLVSEAYLKSAEDITEKHLVWSCTKQVMAILSGIAIENGLIKDIQDPISDYFDTELSNHPDKNAITIRNLLTMQSGIDYNNDGVGGETDKMLRQIPDNSVDFILDRALNTTPGTKFHYNDGNPHLISALIQKMVGMPTDVWAEEVLFSKIGLTNYNWVRYKDGITLGGYGIETTPRELAKIALLVSNNGKYNDQQVISSNWINEMVSPHIEIEDSPYSFGYFWWVDKSGEIQFMWGHGGQFAFIVPSKKLIVVMTSIPNTQGAYQLDGNDAIRIVEKIIKISM